MLRTSTIDGACLPGYSCHKSKDLLREAVQAKTLRRTAMKSPRARRWGTRAASYRDVLAAAHTNRTGTPRSRDLTRCFRVSLAEGASYTVFQSSFWSRLRVLAQPFVRAAPRVRPDLLFPHLTTLPQWFRPLRGKGGSMNAWGLLALLVAQIFITTWLLVKVRGTYLRTRRGEACAEEACAEKPPIRCAGLAWPFSRTDRRHTPRSSTSSKESFSQPFPTRRRLAFGQQ